MIEDIKGFYHQVQPSSFAKWKVFKHAKIKVDEARCAQTISCKTNRTRRKRKGAVVLLVCPSHWIDWSSTAEGNDWSDLDVSEYLANEEVAFASRSFFLFVTKWKIKYPVEHKSVPDVLP